MTPLGRTLLLAVCAALTLGSCATGARPTLDEGSTIDAPTGDRVVDELLSTFGRLDEGAFTARYRITNNFGGLARQATVAQRPDGERSITIGDVRYLITRDSSLTCRPPEQSDTGRGCTEGIDEAAVSDLQITHQFFGRSAAARLRTDARRRIGPTDGYSAEFAGQTVRCASIPVSGGTKVYCVASEGMLAAYQGPDLLIELFDLVPEVDDDAFVP